MPTYYAIITNTGLAREAAAVAGGAPLDFAEFVVGDSGGAYFEPLPSQVSLVAEKWRGPVNRVYVHNQNANWVVIEAIIPPDQGGWDIREAGLVNAAGDLIAVAKYPLTTKPAPGSGAEKDLYVRMVLQVSNAAEVIQTIDPSLVWATQEYVDEHAQRTDNPHGTTAAQAGAYSTAEADAKFLPKTGGTLTGPLTLPASTVDFPSLNLPYGTEPAMPADGDLWGTATSLRTRIAGVARTIIHSGNPTTLASDVSQAEAEGGTSTTRRWWTAQRVAQAIAAQSVGFRATVPTQQDAPIIYVPPYGLMEWVASAGLYRSVDCGQVILHSAATPKAGTIAAGGVLLSKITYAGLWSRAQEDGTVVAAGAWQAGTLQYEDVDAGNFRAPQLGAEFFRAWDNGRGVDAAREFGSSQGDAIRNIVGGLPDIYGGPNMTAVGAFSPSSIVGTGYSNQGGGTNRRADGASNLLDVSRVVPTAAENRPRNVALLACIKY
jgi:phage-related tail fiber protein